MNFTGSPMTRVMMKTKTVTPKMTAPPCSEPACDVATHAATLLSAARSARDRHLLHEQLRVDPRRPLQRSDMP